MKPSGRRPGRRLRSTRRPSSRLPDSDLPPRPSPPPGDSPRRAGSLPSTPRNTPSPTSESARSGVLRRVITPPARLDGPLPPLPRPSSRSRRRLRPIGTPRSEDGGSSGEESDGTPRGAACSPSSFSPPDWLCPACGRGNDSSDDDCPDCHMPRAAASAAALSSSVGLAATVDVLTLTVRPLQKALASSSWPIFEAALTSLVDAARMLGDGLDDHLPPLLDLIAARLRQLAQDYRAAGRRVSFRLSASASSRLITDSKEAEGGKREGKVEEDVDVGSSDASAPARAATIHRSLSALQSYCGSRGRAALSAHAGLRVFDERRRSRS
eukprot:PLAT10978.1.p1 GENE.PLAT10978.1~~PLAT10978.1.p1  ORF type:complete len:325 (-),score=40.69 PLAT10978.1:80-1054(-)